ncbi:MAG: hypothetical protein ACI83P_002444 [Janthinobacterium sp.]|jgi:hypothetical protein
MQTMMAGLALLAALGSSAVVQADDRVYRCIGMDGLKEYTNTDKTGNCSLLDIPGAITSPPKSPAAVFGSPRPAATSPADFPRVDNAAQKARDSDRRQILQDELRSEQQKLAELLKQFNGGRPERQGNESNYAKYLERLEQMKDNIARMEQNIEALKREIANIR